MHKTRTDLLNLICEIRKPQRYLEIGIQKGENFKAINCPVKVGVDPDPNVKDVEGLLRMTSDEYFNPITAKCPNHAYAFDLIFIDGYHSEGQTGIDILNSLKSLNRGGLIVCHDALPRSIKYTSPEWCGTAYKAIMTWADNDTTDIITWEGDHGCAIFREDINADGGYLEGTSFKNLWRNDAEIVNKSTWEEVELWLRNLK